MELGTSYWTERRSELVFLDVETTVPSNKERRFRVLEFGAILVCPKKLVEKKSYCTLIRPDDISVVPESSSRLEGITRDAVSMAPKFEEVADAIYGILHGRVWVGHNILRFDSARIREVFADIDRPAPEPTAMIDSLDILMHKFGPRAGNMKMASLAAYLGLGRQKHRSLDDARLNLQVIRSCATILFLESSLPHILTGEHTESPSSFTRSKTRSRLQVIDETNTRALPTIASKTQRTISPVFQRRQQLLCKSSSSTSRPLLRQVIRRVIAR